MSMKPERKASAVRLPLMAACVLPGAIIAVHFFAPEALAFVPDALSEVPWPGKERLADLLPNDIDSLQSADIISAQAVQLLLLGGFVPSATGWVRDASPPTSLNDRLERITPTWKGGGKLDYTYDADPPPGALSLFGLSRAPATAVPGTGTTVQSLGAALEKVGLRPSDFDAPARHALKEMFTWGLPGGKGQGGDVAELPLPKASLTLLVFSFDATPGCRTVEDCPTPGPSNELLAETAMAFSKKWKEEAGLDVDVISQWEVASAILTRGGASRAVGTPGVFENTGKVFEHMLAASGGSDTCEVPYVLLAHPDHLRRVVRTVETMLAQITPPPPCTPRLLTALQPYHIGWPLQPDAGAARLEGATQLNLFAGVTASVTTHGQTKQASW